VQVFPPDTWTKEINMATSGISSQIFTPPRLQPTAEQQEFRANVRSLIDAIKVGDLESAKEAYAKIEEAQAAEEEEAAQSPFEELLAKLGEALAADDIEAAQQALEAFKASRLSEPPRAIVRLHPDFLSEEARNAFIGLIDSIRSEDLAAARDAYSAFLELSGNSGATATSPIDQFLEQIGAALEADDLDAAKAALAQLAQQRPPGGAVNVTA
jgi:ribosomal protein S20